MKLRMIELAVAALALAACGGVSDVDKTRAVSMANARFSDCLNIAGYDVNPTSMADAAQVGVGPDSVLVYYFSESGGSAIRIYADIVAGTLTAMDSGDIDRLTAAGCR